MLTIIIEGEEFYNETTEEFETVGSVELYLEHSLVSLSKWESKYHKPFLGSGEKTSEEIAYYIMSMVQDPNATYGTLNNLSEKNLEEINKYIESSQSATTFGIMPERKGRGEIITSELIYYWLVAFKIPFECESWHLNRLFSLIRICNIKNSPGKKMPRHEVANRNRELNEKRKAKYGTKG